MTQTTRINAKQFCELVRNRLTQQGYTEVVPQPPLDLALLKQTFGGTIPKVVSVIDGTHSTDMPSVTFERVRGWFKNLLGNGGAGILLFVYQQPPATFVEEVLQLGSEALGYGQVIGGVYDLFSHKYWIPEHLNWAKEIFG